MILSQSIGSYSQTIRIKNVGDNEVEVRRDGQELFNGAATHIIDNHNKLTFKDKTGKQYEFIKFATITSA